MTVQKFGHLVVVFFCPFVLLVRLGLFSVQCLSLIILSQDLCEKFCFFFVVVDIVAHVVVHLQVGYLFRIAKMTF